MANFGRIRTGRIGALLSGACVLLSLCGCVTHNPNLYDWGSYETQVYAHFTNGSSPEQQIAALESLLQKSIAKGTRRPPGYHAHLGLLYGKVGRVAEMQQQFIIEKGLFPEAAPFMDFLLRNGAKKVSSTP